MDTDGLSQTYMTLGQIDEAIGMHIEEAEKLEDGELKADRLHNLRHASGALRSAQTSLKVVLRQEVA